MARALFTLAAAMILTFGLVACGDDGPSGPTRDPVEPAANDWFFSDLYTSWVYVSAEDPGDSLYVEVVGEGEYRGHRLVEYAWCDEARCLGRQGILYFVEDENDVVGLLGWEQREFDEGLDEEVCDFIEFDPPLQFLPGPASNHEGYERREVITCHLEIWIGDDLAYENAGAFEIQTSVLEESTVSTPAGEFVGCEVWHSVGDDVILAKYQWVRNLGWARVQGFHEYNLFVCIPGDWLLVRHARYVEEESPQTKFPRGRIALRAAS